jgi:hypothetical protein
LPCMFPGSRTRPAYFFNHAGTLSGPSVVSWFDDEGNEILVVFKRGAWPSIITAQSLRRARSQDEVTSKEFRRTKLPLYERIKRRIERRIQALRP